MSVVKRAKEINQKIRESEIFPRIRDAERAMFENEEKFLKRRELKKKKKEKLLKQQQLGIKHHVSDPNHLPIIHSKKKKKSTSTPQLDYFNGFVLNKDPRCSKYMPFNEVFFPKLFNPAVDGPNPHSIDMLWMLGFQHEALHQDAVFFALEAIVDVAARRRKNFQKEKEKKYVEFKAKRNKKKKPKKN